MKRFLEATASQLSPLAVQPSTRLRLVAAYFSIGGALSLLTLAIGGAAAAFGSAPARSMFAMLAAHPTRSMLWVGGALGWVWTGRLLSRGERAGGVLAIATLAVPVIGWMLGQPVTITTLVLAALGVIAVASSWRELR